MISYVQPQCYVTSVEVCKLTWQPLARREHSDITLTNIANALGVLSVMLIIVYQFVDVIEKRQNLAGLDTKSQWGCLSYPSNSRSCHACMVSAALQAEWLWYAGLTLWSPAFIIRHCSQSMYNTSQKQCLLLHRRWIPLYHNYTRRFLSTAPIQKDFSCLKLEW